MKIRQGFVSNSSTTSFFLSGWTFPYDRSSDIRDIIFKYVPELVPLWNKEKENSSKDINEDDLWNQFVNYGRKTFAINIQDPNDPTMHDDINLSYISFDEEFFFGIQLFRESDTYGWNKKISLDDKRLSLLKIFSEENDLSTPSVIYLSYWS